MSFTITVNWASFNDKMDGLEFAAERKTKLESMHTEGKLIGFNQNDLSAKTSLTFNTQSDAEEWKTFIQDLATRYNKTILSIVNR